MADIGTIFSNDAAAQIARVVRRVERAPTDARETLRRPPSPQPVEWFSYVNDSSATVPAYGVLRPTTEAAYRSDSGDPILRMTRPSTVFTRIYAVNGPQAVPANKAGVCRFEGPCLIAYDTGTAAPGEGWGPKAGQFTLSKGYPRTTTVIANTTSTAKWLVGTLEPIDTVIGKTTGAMSANTASTGYHIYAGTQGSESALDLEVPAVVSRTTIANNKYIKITFRNDGGECEPLEC